MWSQLAHRCLAALAQVCGFEVLDQHVTVPFETIWMRSETKAPWNNGTRLEMRWAGPEEQTAHVFGSKSEETWTMDPVDVACGIRSLIGEGYGRLENRSGRLFRSRVLQWAQTPSSSHFWRIRFSCGNPTICDGLYTSCTRGGCFHKKVKGRSLPVGRSSVERACGKEL